MLFKIFYQENRNATPRRENTRAIYVDVKSKTTRDGIIKVRELINQKTNYRIEYIDPLSDAAKQYEEETTKYTLTKF